MNRILVALCLVACTALAEDAKITSLMQHNLSRTDGQEGALIMVEYGPGAYSG